MSGEGEGLNRPPWLAPEEWERVARKKEGDSAPGIADVLQAAAEDALMKTRLVMRGAAILRAAKDAARPKGTRSKDPKECPARFSPSDWRAHRRIRDAFRAMELTAQDGKERGSGLVECPMARYCGQVNQELGPHALHLPPEDVRKLAETMRVPGVRPECHVCGESLVEAESLRERSAMAEWKGVPLPEDVAILEADIELLRRTGMEKREKEQTIKSRWFFLVAFIALAFALLGPVSMLNVSAVVAVIAFLLALAGFWREGTKDMIREAVTEASADRDGGGGVE